MLCFKIFSANCLLLMMSVMNFSSSAAATDACDCEMLSSATCLSMLSKSACSDVAAALCSVELCASKPNESLARRTISSCSCLVSVHHSSSCSYVCGAFRIAFSCDSTSDTFGAATEAFLQAACAECNVAAATRGASAMVGAGVALTAGPSYKKDCKSSTSSCDCVCKKLTPATPPLTSVEPACDEIVLSAFDNVATSASLACCSMFARRVKRLQS
mmetsp:Transcript_29399/g.67702  ORF Transcript_29399/g.67702 Transcript_29399/m.67702 type:complete len:216 (-) Transcript_29399:657-1304(-)